MRRRLIEILPLAQRVSHFVEARYIGRGIIAAADEQPFDLQSCCRSEAGNIRRIKAAQFVFANLFLRIARHGEIKHGARYSFSYRGVTFQKPDFNAALDEQFFLNQTVQHEGTVFGGWCLSFVSEKGLQGGGIFGAVYMGVIDAGNRAGLRERASVGLRAGNQRN